MVLFHLGVPLLMSMRSVPPLPNLELGMVPSSTSPTLIYNAIYRFATRMTPFDRTDSLEREMVDQQALGCQWLFPSWAWVGDTWNKSTRYNTMSGLPTRCTDGADESCRELAVIQRSCEMCAASFYVDRLGGRGESAAWRAEVKFKGANPRSDDAADFITHLLSSYVSAMLAAWECRSRGDGSKRAWRFRERLRRYATGSMPKSSEGSRFHASHLYA